MSLRITYIYIIEVNFYTATFKRCFLDEVRTYFEQNNWSDTDIIPQFQTATDQTTWTTAKPPVPSLVASPPARCRQSVRFFCFLTSMVRSPQKLCPYRCISPHLYLKKFHSVYPTLWPLTKTDRYSLPPCWQKDDSSVHWGITLVLVLAE